MEGADGSEEARLRMGRGQGQSAGGIAVCGTTKEEEREQYGEEQEEKEEQVYVDEWKG